MPVINLKIQGKQAIGDYTKIVCMNADYVVRINCKDCAEFIALPRKKLILKAGLEYRESPIDTVNDNGISYLQANLPIVESQKIVEIGVYGMEADSDEPKYTSKPAVFECEKSILCGAVVLKKEPTLDSLDVKENGTYRASDKDVDGFYEVNVSVPGTPNESRTVELDMLLGSQVIEPSEKGRLMSQVVVTKPLALTPSNIRAGITLGGVVGTYDKILTETEVYKDGEYTPPEGVDGFSKVTVRVDSSNYTKLLRVGQYFTYDYNHSVAITVDTPEVIKYENNGKSIIFTAIGTGSCSIILKDLDKDSNIVNTVHYAISVELESERLLPVEVNSPEMMDAYLRDGVVGTVIKYTGATSSGFVNGGIYIIEDGE